MKIQFEEVGLLVGDPSHLPILEEEDVGIASGGFDSEDNLLQIGSDQQVIPYAGASGITERSLSSGYYLDFVRHLGGGGDVSVGISDVSTFGVDPGDPRVVGGGLVQARFTLLGSPYLEVGECSRTGNIYEDPTTTFLSERDSVEQEVSDADFLGADVVSFHF